MRWTTPDFQELCLNSEVTAYVNTDQEPSTPGLPRTTNETAPAGEGKPRAESA
jgi:coenzyme PQQ precursor peptide PqqA